MDTEDKLLKAMLDSFKLEMSERVLALTQHLASLEDLVMDETETAKDAKVSEIIGALFRELHNLKGAARAVNLPTIEELCHVSEGLLVRLRALSPSFDMETPEFNHILDLIYQSVDWDGQLLNLLNLGQKLESQGLTNFIKFLAEEEKITPKTPQPAQGFEAISQPPQSLSENLEELYKPKGLRRHTGFSLSGSSNNSVRISGSKLDELLAASTELLVARMRMGQHREEIAKVLNEGQTWLRLWRGVRGGYSRLVKRTTVPGKAGHRDNDLNNLLHFVDLNQQYIKQLENNLTHLHAQFIRDVAYLSNVTDQLQFETRRLRLIPLATVKEELERVVRHLARDLGKQVQLVMHGTELELDKKLLDELKAPLLHLLRNALDHGMESPAQRLHKGKPATGTINISFVQTGNLIELEVRDDGAGLDLTWIKEVAIERGLVTAQAAAELDQRGLIEFIFQPGFSTRQEVNGVSGRGIGMDAVREVVTRLGGNLDVITVFGSGTSFRLSVPNVLITTEGIVLKSNNQTFVVALDSVERSFLLNEVEVQNLGARQYLVYNGKQVLLTSLAAVLELPSKSPPKNNLYVMVLQSRGRYSAFIVDELLKNQEVVVKSFSKPLVQVRWASGATIMANGQVALILNVEELIRAATQFRVSPVAETEKQLPADSNPQPKNQSHILVVDDSITIRTLEKTILEGAGFFVQTACNGVEAMSYLRTSNFDLVITDMEMPEMDGFHLTQNIKRDQRLAELPVIVVTSLDKPEDKARGLEAGADAYVVKNRFDQQGLLTIIQQLV